MPLRLITVDLWNTLLGAAGSARRHNARMERLRAYALSYGREPQPQELQQALQRAWEYYNACWRGQQRTPTVVELTEILWRHLGLRHDPARLARLAEELAADILDHPPPLLPGARTALQQLAARYLLGLISDTAFSPGSVLRELLRRYGIAELFTAFSFSDETGVAKPHPHAYRAVLTHLGTLPEQALHIGDLEETDILGAKQLGMHAVLFLGDSDSEFPKPQHTRADAIATHWEQVPQLIEQLQTAP